MRKTKAAWASATLWGGHLALDVASGGSHLVVDALLWVAVAAGLLTVVRRWVGRP